MNVTHNNPHRPPRRGVRGQNSGRQRTPNILPKYDFDDGFRRPFLNMLPINASTVRTPARRYRGRGTSSSSLLRSSTRYGSSSSRNAAGTSSSTPSMAASSAVIIAITGGRGDAKGEVGIAAVDVHHPHLVLCQMSDLQTYTNTLTKIHLFQPVEILLPETMSGRSVNSSKLYESIRSRFHDVNITAVSRRHFSDAIGLDFIRNLCAEEYSAVELFVKQKFYALAAAAALLKYVEFIQHIIFAPKSMRIEFQGSEDSTMIDIESATSLELVSLCGNAWDCSLLSSLDRCSTPGGRRHLRASILQPPCKEDFIKERQECVEEMVTDSALLSSVQSVLHRLSGVDRLLSLSINSLRNDNIQKAERNLNYVLLLKSSLETIPSLQAALQNAEAEFFGKVRENLRDPRFEMILEKIQEIIQPEARSVMGFTSANMQRCFALKSGINQMLDIARQTYCELIDELKSAVEHLAAKYNYPLTLGCSATLGYYIQMDAPKHRQIEITDLPSEFIVVQKQKNCYCVTTAPVHVMSQRCKDASEELHIMSNVILEEMLHDIRKHIGCLYQLSTNVAELDLIASLAKISSVHKYVKPSFGPSLNLKNSLHPIMDISLCSKPVPNDVTASVSTNFHIITGPNMSGKTVFIKQIVLLQIMAQIGCFVPAEKVQLRIADRIFCRILFGNDIESNASSFVHEIKEVQYILQMVTPKSLVIMDELCRGVTVDEGTSIAWSVCEHLLRSSAFTFFTTHFLSLTRLEVLYNNVMNHNFETFTEVREDAVGLRLMYTHRIVPGVVSVENYGIALARNSGVSNALVDMAQQFSSTLAQDIKPIEESEENTNQKERRSYKCISEMRRLIDDNKFTNAAVLELIRELHNDDNSIPMETNGIFQTNQNETPMITDEKKSHTLFFEYKTLEVTSEMETNVKSGRNRSMSSIAASEGSHIPKDPHEPSGNRNTYIHEKSMCNTAADVSMKNAKYPLETDAISTTHVEDSKRNYQSQNFKRFATPLKEMPVNSSTSHRRQESSFRIPTSEVGTTKKSERKSFMRNNESEIVIKTLIPDRSGISNAADVGTIIPLYPLEPQGTATPVQVTNWNSQSSPKKAMTPRTSALNFKRIRTPLKEMSVNSSASHRKQVSFPLPSTSEEATTEKSGRKSVVSNIKSHKHSHVPKDPRQSKFVMNTSFADKSSNSNVADVSSQIRRYPLEPEITATPVQGNNWNSQSSLESAMSLRTPALNFKTIRTPSSEVSVGLVSRDLRQGSPLNITCLAEPDRPVKRIARMPITSTPYTSTSYNSEHIFLTDIESINSNTDENEDSDDIYDSASSNLSQSSDYFIQRRINVSTPISSTSTECARISARRKEAEIFRVIEGDQFRESDFYESCLTDNDSLVILDD